MILRHPLRQWTVEVSDAPEFAGDHYEVLLRETTRIGRHCELFIVACDRYPDDAVLLLLLFRDGSVQSAEARTLQVPRVDPPMPQILSDVSPKRCLGPSFTVKASKSEGKPASKLVCQHDVPLA